MDLPSHIRDLLQTNYFVSAEELNKPLDEMSPYVRDLITSKCMNGKDFVSEAETADIANAQALEDINADVSANESVQIARFIRNSAALDGILANAANNSKSKSDFDRAADLLAVKRMASDEYADAPKNAETFRHARNEIKKELKIKYWAARYYDAHPVSTDGNQARTVADIAEIAQMVHANQTDKIAARFDLPDTEQARDSAKSATLSFAMADALTFADRVKAHLKESAFVKRVESLNSRFQQKYPKTYIASKIAANGASAIVLGPVFSAFKAASTVASMRKDYAKYKKENGAKGSVWSFLKTNEGRQKLMTFGQNTLRIIPGMRAAGIALGAVKNSDSLVASIKEIKQNGGSKKAWMKVGACTVGLLAVATTAAYANDEVAEAVNDFVHDHLGNAAEKAYEAADVLTADSQTVSTEFPNGFNEMHIHSDGSVEFNGVFNQTYPTAEGGLRVSHVGYDTGNHSGRVVLTDNESGVSLSADKHGSSYGIGVEKGNDNAVHISSGHGIEAKAGNIKIGENTEIQSVRAEAAGPDGVSVGGAIKTEDSRYIFGADGNGARINRDLPGGSATVEANKDGVNLSGVFNQKAHDGDGFTLTHAHGDLNHHQAGIGVTDNKTGVVYSAETRGTAHEASIEKDIDNRVSYSTATGAKVRAGNIKIGENTEIQSVRAEAAGPDGVSVGGAIKTEDSRYIFGADGNGARINRDLPGGSATVEANKDGVNLSGVFNQKAHDGDGFTLTHAHGDLNHHQAGIGVTDNKTGVVYSAETRGTAHEASIEKDIDNRVSYSTATGAKVRAGNIKIGENSEIQSVRAEAGGRDGFSVGGAVKTEDSRYIIGADNNGARVSRDMPGGSANVQVDNHGKVSGRVVTNVNTGKSGNGFTLTRVEADTKGEGAATFTNGRTGRGVKISGDAHGNASVSIDGRDANATTVSVDRRGDVSIGRTNGRKINISNVIRGIKRFTR